MAPTLPPPVSAEQALLESVFLSLSQFAHDKAKEMVEKEQQHQRELHKNSIHTLWTQTLGCLVQFAVGEKAYVTLAFSHPRGILKQYNLKKSYENLRIELRRLTEMGGLALSSPAGVDSLEKLLSHLCGQLNDFVEARIEMVELYDRIASASSKATPNYNDLDRIISEVIKMHQKSFHHPILSPLKSMFTYECDILKHLVSATMEMMQWHFLPSLLHLNDAHTKLKSWSPLMLVKESSKSLLNFASSRQSSTTPALYQWIMNFHSCLVSKFTLYFYDILSKQTVPDEMRKLTAKNSVDFVYKISQFHRKNDVHTVAIVLVAHELKDTYKGHGYSHPGKVVDAPVGLDSYPAIFSYPIDRPAVHWPNVVMIMTEREKDLSAYDRSVCFYDNGVDSTYFLTRIETSKVLLVICDGKRTEKESSICNFMLELSNQLRFTQLFASIKPGSKMMKPSGV